MSNFTLGGIYPINPALELVASQIGLAESIIRQVLVSREYVEDSFICDHVSDIVREIVAADATFLGRMHDADDKLPVASGALDALPPNALFPADPLKHVPRYVARKTTFDRASADAHVSYAGPGELRRETRQLADMHKIDLWSIAEKAREIAEREAAIKADNVRIAEEARIERVRRKTHDESDPTTETRGNRVGLFGGFR